MVIGDRCTIRVLKEGTKYTSLAPYNGGRTLLEGDLLTATYAGTSNGLDEFTFDNYLVWYCSPAEFELVLSTTKSDDISCL